MRHTRCVPRATSHAPRATSHDTRHATRHARHGTRHSGRAQARGQSRLHGGRASGGRRVSRAPRPRSHASPTPDARLGRAAGAHLVEVSVTRARLRSGGASSAQIRVRRAPDGAGHRAKPSARRGALGAAIRRAAGRTDAGRTQVDSRRNAGGMQADHRPPRLALPRPVRSRTDVRLGLRLRLRLGAGGCGRGWGSDH